MSENRFEEKFEVHPEAKSHFYAHIPQDFNLDLETHGSIRGVNLGDSKYLGTATRFVTHGEDSSIAARWVRTDSYFIKSVGGAVEFGSYLEAQNLLLETCGNILVAKRLGIAQKGEIFQTNTKIPGQRLKFKVGSLFSNMASLPRQNFEGFEMNFEKEFEYVKNKPFESGLQLHSNGQITIDNLQGVLSIK